MKPSTALRLARPGSTADRRRFLLIAGSMAVASALLLAALHILRLPTDIDPTSGGIGEPLTDDSDQARGLARYLTDTSLRPGVVIAALLLAVPILAFTVQALRLGSVARDRRMASLRLAGATPRDVRTVAAAEAGGAAVAGSLLAGPAYVLLWLLAGVLPPIGSRMLDTPDALDLATWAGLVPTAGAAGALAAAVIHGRAVLEPLGVRRRDRPPAPGRASRAVLIAGIALVLAGFVSFSSLTRHSAVELGVLVLTMIGLLLAAFAGGPRLVLASAHGLGRRRGAEALLAGRRLRADPHSAGRVAGVLVVCGVALGIEGLLLAELVFDLGFGDDAAFYLTGYGMAALAVLVAAAVALLTLLVGAADGLLDARRPLAALAALGVEEQTLVRALARQLSATAVPPVALGALVGGPGMALYIASANGEPALGATVQALLPAGVTALAAALVVAVVARLAARRLSSLIRAATDPENLRVA